MSDYEYPNQDYASSNAQSALNAKAKEAIRERLQGANKRAYGVLEMVGDLMRAIEPPLPIAGVGQSTQIKDSTISTDLDELISTLAGIENGVMRMTKAISG